MWGYARQKRPTTAGSTGVLLALARKIARTAPFTTRARYLLSSADVTSRRSATIPADERGLKEMGGNSIPGSRIHGMNEMHTLVVSAISALETARLSEEAQYLH